MKSLGTRHRVTLARIFERPRRSDIRWAEVESMLIAMGAAVSQGRGSRTRVLLNGRRAVFHRPHPGDEMNKGSVASLERFLTEAASETEE